MTKQPKDTVAVSISTDILDFIQEQIETRRFADLSHAFELMAFDYMKHFEPKDESTLEKLERLTRSTVRRSVDAVRDTAETVQDTTVKAYRGSAEKVRESGVGKTVKDSADKVQDGTRRMLRYSTEKLRESVGKVKDTISPGSGEGEHEGTPPEGGEPVGKSGRGKRIGIDEENR